MKTNLFASESVTCGHPDKVCDQIADGILDSLLSQDSHSRVACEVTCATDTVHIFGEITSKAKVNYEKVARQVIRDIGYTTPNLGFDADTCVISVELHEQSPDIAMGVDGDTAVESGAGDQGIMFGYACRETKSFMPLPIELAHELAKRLEQVRREGVLPYLLPDEKTQVTVEYEDDNKPLRIDAIVVSSQHMDYVTMEQIREDILKYVIMPVVPEQMLDDKSKYFINLTGRFVMGGPAADSGLTGRKIILDTYGGYAIGVAEPVSFRIDTFGTEHVSLQNIYESVLNAVDLRPMAIIKKFKLREPKFSNVSCYGHFGKSAAEMPWEQIDLELN